MLTYPTRARVIDLSFTGGDGYSLHVAYGEGGPLFQKAYLLSAL
jgi:hypothetical protein